MRLRSANTTTCSSGSTNSMLCRPSTRGRMVPTTSRHSSRRSTRSRFRTRVSSSREVSSICSTSISISLSFAITMGSTDLDWGVSGPSASSSSMDT